MESIARKGEATVITDKERKPSDAFDLALRYLNAEGWPTHSFDRETAESIYVSWLQATQTSWKKTGYRDRDCLRDELLRVFTTRHGEQGGLARVLVFALLFECRAREEGHVRRVSKDT
jgi:hypothetical protein